MGNSIETAFPVGYELFNSDAHLNYELNRWYSFGCAGFDDLVQAGQLIHNFEEWVMVMTQFGDKYLQQEDLFHAAFFYRAAEFFTLPDDPRKEDLYAKFLQYFYSFYDGDNFEKFEIPYEGKILGAIRIPAKNPTMGTLVVQGGFDSFMEEMYPMLRAINDNYGYEIILFEGPGQGSVLRKYGLPFIVEWEKPTRALLDYFQLSDVTLLGISMGGYFALRAAAFDSRIKRVIAFDCFDGPDTVFQHFSGFRKLMIKMVLSLGAKSFMNRICEKMMQADLMQSWTFHHGMFVLGQPSPFDFTKFTLRFSILPVVSRIHQDVLLLAGQEDHMIPLKCYIDQMKSIKKAHSLTGRVFTKEDQAAAHCQVGNIPLALKTIINWIQTHQNAPI